MSENIPVTPSVEAEPNAGAQAIYDFLRTSTIAWKTVGRKELMRHIPEGMEKDAFVALVDAIGTDACAEELKAIAFIKMAKDAYYYEQTLMTAQYAEIDAMLQEKDLLKTIASVTRKDCSLYPRPTQFSKLMDFPFRMTMDELLGAAARMKFDPEYADIDVTEASNGAKGFYSTKFMSPKYARALIEQVEVEEHLNP